MTIPQPVIDEAFFAHLTADDEMGVVLRAQIHIEASVIEFIEACIPYPDELPRMQFAARLRLACSLGLRADYLEVLKSLGDLRNRFAHKLDMRLDDLTLSQLHSKLPEDGKDLVVRAYRAAMAKRGETSYPSFEKLPPKDRFVLTAVVLKSFVVAAAHTVKVS